MMSPAPLTLIGALGVRSRQSAPFSETSMSIASAGRVVEDERSDEDRARAALMQDVQRRACARHVWSKARPEMRSSSKWLGVRIVAAGRARSRMNSATPART